MKFGRQVNVETIPVPREAYSKEDMKAISDSFVQHYRALYGDGAAFVEAGIEIMTFVVHAVKPADLPPMPTFEIHGEDSSHALKGKREVFFTEDENFVPVDIYEFGRLEAGNTIKGPAIVEAPTTTMLILTGQSAVVDEYKNLRVTEI